MLNDAQIRQFHEATAHLPDDLKETLWASIEALDQFASHLDPDTEARGKQTGELVPVHGEHLLGVFDQRMVTLAEREVKWYSPNTALGDRTGPTRRTKKKKICIHHSAVPGGFGVWKSQLDYFLQPQIIAERDENGNLVAHHVGKWIVPGAFIDTDLEWAHAMALGARYRGHPRAEYNGGESYHAITGANSVLYLNLPFEWVSWHGNGANNDCLGYAWDGNSRKQSISADLALDLQDDLWKLYDLAMHEDNEIEELTCHCCYTNKPDDPGKEYVLEVMVPTAKKLDLKIDWKFKTNGGKSLAEVVS